MALGADQIWLFLSSQNILENKRIEIYNHGNHYRDFTYIDDIVNGIIKSSKKRY